MSKKYLKIVLWTAVALWMAVIFGFSAETAEESTETSDSIVDVVVDQLLEDEKTTLSSNEFNSIKEKISLLVRKIAHFSSYMLLGILTLSALYQHDLKNKTRRTAAFVICTLYAVSDELHQLFVPGRAGRLLDVMIDSAGALCGILAVSVAALLINKQKNKNSDTI